MSNYVKTGQFLHALRFSQKLYTITFQWERNRGLVRLIEDRVRIIAPVLTQTAEESVPMPEAKILFQKMQETERLTRFNNGKQRRCSRDAQRARGERTL